MPEPSLREAIERHIQWLETLPLRREGAHATYNGGHHNEIARRAFHHGMDTVYNILDARAAIDLPRLYAAWLGIPKCRCCGQGVTWYELPVGDSPELLCSDCGAIAFWAGLGGSITEDLPF